MGTPKAKYCYMIIGIDSSVSVVGSCFFLSTSYDDILTSYALHDLISRNIEFNIQLLKKVDSSTVNQTFPSTSSMFSDHEIGLASYSS